MKNTIINEPFYKEIQSEIIRIEKKVDFYTYLFYLSRFLNILFTGLITIISGSNNHLKKHSKRILFLRAFITSITSLDTLFQVEAKMNRYKLVLFELRNIKSELIYRYFQAQLINGKKQIGEKIIEELFKKYNKVNSYIRDLISTDIEQDSTKYAE